MNKITVTKQGDVYRVGVDAASGQPYNLASFADEQGFMMTYVGLPELKASWPGREFEFLEAPATKENVVQPLSREQQSKVSDLLKRNGLPATASTRMVAVATATGEELPAVRTTVSSKIQEFLRRLETAREYASKKNQGTLDIKIATVKELINEIG